MPPLSRPDKNEKITVPASEALVAAETDVLVVGGGSAGIGASFGAARAGGEVILAERYGFLGGAATVALVMPFMSAHTQEFTFRKPGKSNLFPSDHGEGTRVIAGVLLELVNRLIENGGAVLPSFETGYVMPFDPEVLKSTALSMLDDSNVRVLLHSFAFSYSRGEDFSTVFFMTKSGPVAIRARCIVDCTGDGDVAYLAGAPYKIGRETDGLVQPMTLYFRMVGFHRPAFVEYVRKHPEQWYGVFGLWDLIEKATAEGKLKFPREDLLMFATPHDQEVSVNSTRVGGLAVDVFDLTVSEWENRKQAHEVSEFLRKWVPGFENSYMVQTGVQVGIRESRRIMGEYVLKGEDIIEARRFDDVIARSAYPLDIHNPRERVPVWSGFLLERLTIFPSGVSNLWGVMIFLLAVVVFPVLTKHTHPTG